MGDTHLILIVEDDDAISEAMVETLQDAGYTTRSASNGRDALDQLRAGLDPCLILLDMMMPVMSGWELRDELRRDPALAHIPICVVSAYSASMPMPADTLCVLPKPIQLPKLLGIIEEHC
jgi:CheY-like chemotaxis protein